MYVAMKGVRTLVARLLVGGFRPWSYPTVIDYELLPSSTSNRRPVASVKRYPRYLLVVYLLLFLLIVTVTSTRILGGSTTSLRKKYPSLLNITIDELSNGLLSGDFTSVGLVKIYLQRIAEVNDELRAVVELNPDALEIAAKLDVERSKGSLRGPLHGIPILIKDNIGTDDQMNTTAGSYALLGAKASQDATVVQKLRKSGAILLGKTSLTQWANWRSLNSSNGWSARSGQGYSPYYYHGDPAGSSSGSGVATALGLSTASLGTETDGSIISPASYNNLVGIKPTVGLTSRHMVIPVTRHQDTVGPLSRTVKDAAYLLKAIAGVDTNDNYTYDIPNYTVPDYVAACDLSALSGARLGVPYNVMSLLSTNWTDPITDAFQGALAILESAGAVIVEANLTAAVEYQSSDLPILLSNADFIVDLQRYLDSLIYNPNNITSLAALREFTRSSPLEQYPTRDTGRWDQALQQEFNNTDPRFWSMYQKYLYYGNEGGLLGALRRKDLDAIVLPTDFAESWSAPVGSPVVAVPMGAFPEGTPMRNTTWGSVLTAPNIPFGLSFLGARFTESKLIGLAFAFEQRTQIRKKVQPYITPKAELADLVGKEHEKIRLSLINRALGARLR